MTDQLYAVRPAHRTGTTAPSGDAHAVHTLPGGHTTAAAVVDGIGHSTEVAAWAHAAAEVAARVAARRGALLGLLAAAEMTATTGPSRGPDGPAVVAVTEPGQPARIAWIGDVRAYGTDGTDLRQYTTDQTMGHWLRVSGGPAVDLDTAAGHDHWVLATLGRCSIATVRQAEIPAGRPVLLTSDGVHDQVPHAQMERLVGEHGGAPQALADALVAAAAAGDDDRRDDATVIVLTP